MELDVAVLVVPERPTAVIAETTTWAEWPQLWPALLDEVWREVRARPELTPGRNVMLYRDDVPNVEAGVEVAEPFAGLGRVVCSSLPARPRRDGDAARPVRADRRRPTRR